MRTEDIFIPTLGLQGNDFFLNHLGGELRVLKLNFINRVNTSQVAIILDA